MRTYLCGSISWRGSIRGWHVFGNINFELNILPWRVLTEITDRLNSNLSLEISPEAMKKVTLGQLSKDDSNTKSEFE